MRGEWLTPKETKEKLKVSGSTVRQMLRDGRLRGHRLRGSRLIRIAAEDLEALLVPLTVRCPQENAHE
jgi:excisionase family DNA binding protein